MNSDKLADVRSTVVWEHENLGGAYVDQEAVDAINAEVARRFSASIYA
jgi:hypothetical protein